MTHGEFAQAVMKEWDVDPIKLQQVCYFQWYMYLIRVNGKTKVIGKYTLGLDKKPTFVLVRKDGSERHIDVTE